MRSTMDREVWGSDLGQIGHGFANSLPTAATFLRKNLCCRGARTPRRATHTRYTLRRNAARKMKNLIDFNVVYYLHCHTT